MTITTNNTRIFDRNAGLIAMHVDYSNNIAEVMHRIKGKEHVTVIYGVEQTTLRSFWNAEAPTRFYNRMVKPCSTLAMTGRRFWDGAGTVHRTRAKYPELWPATLLESDFEEFRSDWADGVFFDNEVGSFSGPGLHQKLTTEGYAELVSMQQMMNLERDNQFAFLPIRLPRVPVSLPDDKPVEMPINTGTKYHWWMGETPEPLMYEI